MINTDEYVEYWGDENLLKYDAAVVNSLSIPVESKRFLAEIGLPCGGAYYFPLQATDPLMPYMESVCFHADRVPPRYRRIRLLGNRVLSLERPVRYGICEEDLGAIYAVRDSPTMDVEIFFVNSSVQLYGEFMVRLERWSAWLYGAAATNECVDEMGAAASLVAILRETDPPACEQETPSGIETELGPVIAQIQITGQF